MNTLKKQVYKDHLAPWEPTSIFLFEEDDGKSKIKIIEALVGFANGHFDQKPEIFQKYYIRLSQHYFTFAKVKKCMKIR